MTDAQLDQILTLQLAVAWAGEANTDPARLGWWRTAMCDVDGGEDLLQRLTPKTWRWGVLESARAAAKKVDERARSRAEDSDNLLTLFRLGFVVDEQLDERLRDLKLSEVPPAEALPDLAAVFGDWSPDRFSAWLQELGEAGYSPTATGRRLKGEAPADPWDAAGKLTAALLPLDAEYALPHFRVGR